MIAKFDGNGTVQWARAFGGVNTDEAYAIGETAQGLVAIGSERSFSNSIFALSFKPNGDFRWGKSYGADTVSSAVGGGTTFDGGVFIASERNSTTLGIPATASTLIRTDTLGNTPGCCEQGSYTTVKNLNLTAVTRILSRAVVSIPITALSVTASTRNYYTTRLCNSDEDYL